jgi:uncharacterized membrane protein YdcZ (DUF606 family)
MAGILISLVIGALGVLQNTLNKQYSASLGIGLTLLVNGIVVCACGLAFFLALRLIPAASLPELFRPVAAARGIRAYDLLPGLFGFLIIAACPWVIERLGATRVFIAIIAAQLVVSMMWDWSVEGLPPTAWRMAGGALALLGACLAVL